MYIDRKIIKKLIGPLENALKRDPILFKKYVL